MVLMILSAPSLSLAERNLDSVTLEVKKGISFAKYVDLPVSNFAKDKNQVLKLFADFKENNF